MREQLDDGRYEKIRKKMMEPEYEFHSGAGTVQNGGLN